MSTLIRNALRTPDGTVIESRHRHDYVTHVDQTNGKKYMIDGGLDYIRASAWGDEMHLSVYLEDGHERVREALEWGTYGKNGDEPYHLVKLKDMTTEHIEACLDTQTRMYPQIRRAMENELISREVIENTDENWDSRKLGADERFVKVVDLEHDEELKNALSEENDK